MKFFAAVGAFLVLNHIMMWIWTHVADGDDWYCGEDYVALSIVRWFKIFCYSTIFIFAVWIVQQGAKTELEIKADAMNMHCVPIDDAEQSKDEPIQY